MVPNFYGFFAHGWQLNLALIGIAIAITLGAALLANLWPRLFTLLFVVIFTYILILGVASFYAAQSGFDEAAREALFNRTLAKEFPSVLERRIRKMESRLQIMKRALEERESP